MSDCGKPRNLTVPIVPIVRLALVAIVLVGCSSQIAFSAPGVPIASTSVPATPSVSPTPAPELTLLEQGRLYLAIDRPYYRRLCSFNTRWAGRTDWTAMASAIDRLASVHRMWADELRKIAWTREVRSDIKRLVRNLAAQEAAMRAEAAASNRVTFWRVNRQVYKLNVRGAQMANAVRGTLGLESIGGDACDDSS